MGIVVTGGAGFIGGHLVERLASVSERNIVVVDNLHRACIDPRNFPEKVRFHRADIRDRAALEKAMRGCKVVFHLAAQSNVMGAVFDGDYALSSNVQGTYNVLRAAASVGAKRMVFTSSREVYGDRKKLPVRESVALRPKNGYGASKAAGEVYCRAAAVEKVETVILRLANVYGPRDRDRVIPLFSRAALAGEPLRLYGGDQILDFVWIDTVVDALIKAAFGPAIKVPVNVGSGKGTTIADLARRVVGMAGSPSPIDILPRRKHEVGRFVADVARAQRALDLTPPEDPLYRLGDVLFSTPHVAVRAAAAGAALRKAV
jgi:UDP-glucose 4-epimerase